MCRRRLPLTVRCLLLGAWLLCMLQTPRECAAASESDLTYLKRLSLENLLGIEVSTVSKKTETLSSAAAAIHVVTREDIRRSGSRGLPEVLRLVPGLQVARIDAHTWAVSARGANGLFANKLLVLIDGRSVYTPLFSGVYWDVQNPLLEDIERIEVIRGPGAAIWGANAVNGVINVITRRAEQTQGWLLRAGTGNTDRATGAVRYGGRLGERGHFRIYGTYADRDNFLDDQGDEAKNGWDNVQGGFRLDWSATPKDQLTLQGDIYHSESTQSLYFVSLARTYPDGLCARVDAFGGNLLARWQHGMPSGGSLTVQSYYDRTERKDIFLDERRDTWDLDFTHRFAPIANLELVWGLGYRITADRTSPGLSSAMVPADRNTQLFSFFIQDDLALCDDRLHLILGSKLEHNDYTGWEVQPSVRLRWTPTPRHTLWAAVSQAMRSPSRSEHDMQAVSGVTTGGTPPLTTVRMVLGDPDYRSEELLACELGYRTQPHPRLALDIALFYNNYSHLRTVTADEPVPAGSGIAILPLKFGNRMRGESYGLEALLDLRLRDGWHLTFGYSWLRVALHAARDVLEATGELTEGNDPEHRFSVRSSMDLPGHWSLDTALFYCDSLHDGQLPAYWRLDIRLGWRPCQAMEISLKTENLLDGEHAEFKETIFNTRPTQVPRSILGEITWRF
jgi:iron complex outermembrane receptor protein